MTTRMPRPHRALAVAGLALALVAGACGDDTTAGPTTLQPPVPVHAVPGGDGASADRAASPEAAGLADTSMVAPWVVVDYLIGESMPELWTTANGWHYPGGAAPAPAAIAEVAAALGVPGAVVAIPAAQGSGWRVGPDDGTAPALWVSADGQLSWWYSAAWATDGGRGGVSVGCAVPADVATPDGPAIEEEPPGSSDEPVTTGETKPAPEPIAVGEPAPGGEDCVYEEPTPPEGVLTAEEARARATTILSDLGVDPATIELEAGADDWSAWVNGSLRLGGVSAPASFSFGFGAQGRLDWANGLLGSPEEVGPYPLVSLDEAVARLRDGFGGWGRPMPLLAQDTGAADEPGIAVDRPVCEAGKDECEAPVPEEVTVTLVDVRRDLWWAWESDGSVWLLPAFAFVGDDGGIYTVPAVTDEYLVFDDGAMVDDGGAVEPGEPAPGTVVDPAEPVSGGAGDPGGVAEISPEQADALVGLTEDEALDVAESSRWTVRVVARDDERFAVTDDYSTTRVNLTIVAGIVTSATVG